MMPEDKIYDDDDDDIYIIIITIISIKREGRFWQEPEPSRATGMALALLPPQGRHAVDFFTRKIRRLWPGSNPLSWVPEASLLTTRPPKPTFVADSYHIEDG